jgi:hypothetical protein
MRPLRGCGVSSLVVEGAAIAAHFEACYVERILTPSLKGGQIVVMDNLTRPQGQAGQRPDRGEGLRATLPKMHPSRAITLHTAVELHFKCYILIVFYSFAIVLSRTAC